MSNIHILPLLVLILILSSCTKKIENSKTQERAGLLYEINSNEPFTGRVLYDNDGYTSYKNGLKHGPSIIFYANGQKMEEVDWGNGYPEGTVKFWDSDGTSLVDTILFYSKFTLFDKLIGYWQAPFSNLTPKDAQFFVFIRDGRGCSGINYDDFGTYQLFERDIFYTINAKFVDKEIELECDALKLSPFSNVVERSKITLIISFASFDKIILENGIIYERVSLDDRRVGINIYKYLPKYFTNESIKKFEKLSFE